jgi:hypothetical protein
MAGWTKRIQSFLISISAGFDPVNKISKLQLGSNPWTGGFGPQKRRQVGLPAWVETN